jgi:hypothetical protein
VALGRKLQDVFDRYVAAILKKGIDKFDFYKMVPALENRLAKDEVGIKSPQFFAKVFEELNDPRSNWKVDYEDLKTFLLVLPKEWIKRKITPEILVQWIPKEDWELFGRSSTASLKRQAMASYVAGLRKDGVNAVAVSRRIEGGWNVQVYLGDVSRLVDARSANHYDHAYDALEQVIGKGPMTAAMKREFKEDFRIKAWPNLAGVQSAFYEVEIDAPGKPAWMVERRTIQAVGRIVPV